MPDEILNAGEPKFAFSVCAPELAPLKAIKYTPVLHRYDGRTELAFLNRCASGLNEGYNEQGTSTIVVYEIRQ